MTISDLIQVNKHGEVVGGGKPGRRLANKAGFIIHSAIHEARSVSITPYSESNILDR